MEPTVVALRQECADLRAQFSADAARLQEVASAALAECAEQRKELDRLRPAAAAQSGALGGVDFDEEPQSSPEIVEAMREMERLEFSLLEEKRKSACLLEEKKSVEESHSRDVAMLENMLQQTLLENERLADQISAWEVNKLDNAGQIKEELPQLDSDGSHDPCVRAQLSPSDAHEPETEPRFFD